MDGFPKSRLQGPVGLTGLLDQVFRARLVGLDVLVRIELQGLLCRVCLVRFAGLGLLFGIYQVRIA